MPLHLLGHLIYAKAGYRASPQTRPGASTRKPMILKSFFSNLLLMSICVDDALGIKFFGLGVGEGFARGALILNAWNLGASTCVGHGPRLWRTLQHIPCVRLEPDELRELEVALFGFSDHEVAREPDDVEDEDSEALPPARKIHEKTTALGEARDGEGQTHVDDRP